MTLPEEGYRLRIFVGESDKHSSIPLYEWIVVEARLYYPNPSLF
jgi:uncharacterized protein